jgi:hypothetical protein
VAVKYFPKLALPPEQHHKDKPSTIVLEDSKLQIKFDKDSGALIGLVWKPAA